MHVLKSELSGPVAPERLANVVRRGPLLDVLTARKWLDPAVCARLVDACDADGKAWTNARTWYLPLADWPEAEEALNQTGKLVEAVTHLPVKRINPLVVHWEPGRKMGAHLDIGASREFLNRRWATVIYLNTVTGGGQTRFPAYGLELQPETGLMATWPGGYLHHAVEETRQDRYTLICWWGPTGEITQTKTPPQP